MNKDYSLTLKATDGDDVLSNPSITVTWGDGEITNEGGITSSGVAISHIYKNVGTYTWKAIADSTNGLSSEELSGVVQVSNEQVSNSGYTKICNNGKLAGEGSCPIDPILGAASNDWACTKDNKTGLIWEVKTKPNSGLHDMENRYTWYEPTLNKNGGNAGKKNGGSCIGSECDTYAYTNAVNKQNFCGSKDWRTPTVEEINSLVKNSTGKVPTIDEAYFPNTFDSWFLSSDSDVDSNANVWQVYFGTGFSNVFAKSSAANVRLVHGMLRGGDYDLGMGGTNESRYIKNADGSFTKKKDDLSLVGLMDKTWVTGQPLRVRFINGSSAVQKNIFNLVLKEWGTSVNLNIVNVTGLKDRTAEIRIRLSQPLAISRIVNGVTVTEDDPVSHSFIGTDSMTKGLTPTGESVPASPKNMMISNYASISYAMDVQPKVVTDKGKSTVVDGDKYTILHEFGHALGFGHEHVSVNVNIPWFSDENTMIYFKDRNQTWSDEDVRYNVFNEKCVSWNINGVCVRYSKLTENTAESAFDSMSIMVYDIPFPASLRNGTPINLTKNSFSTPRSQTLSSIDRTFAATVYPKATVKPPVVVSTGYYRNKNDSSGAVYYVNSVARTFCHVKNESDIDKSKKMNIVSNNNFKLGGLISTYDCTGYYRVDGTAPVYSVNAVTGTFCHVKNEFDMNLLGGGGTSGSCWRQQICNWAKLQG